jgi:hypothetical protein
MDTAMPLQLLQPLDSNNPASIPVPLAGPEQRLIVALDPGVGDESLLPPSQLLITKDGESRSIWPVHLAGWLALGWQLHTQRPEAAPEPKQPEPDQGAGPDGEPKPEPFFEPALERESAATTELEPPTETATGGAGGGDALLAAEVTDFQAMTKSQIVDYCSAVHGVDLDSSQTKAELIEQATALEAQANDTAAADLAALELGDALL